MDRVIFVLPDSEDSQLSRQKTSFTRKAPNPKHNKAPENK